MSGAYIEEELDRYISSHNPQSAADIERLEKIFWQDKLKGKGYI